MCIGGRLTACAAAAPVRTPLPRRINAGGGGGGAGGSVSEIYEAALMGRGAEGAALRPPLINPDGTRRMLTPAERRLVEDYR